MHGFPTLKESSTYLGRVNTHPNRPERYTVLFFCFFGDKYWLINDLWEAEREKNGEKRDILREKDAWARLKHNGSS